MNVTFSNEQKQNVTEKCVALFKRKRKRMMMLRRIRRRRRLMIDTYKWKTHFKSIMEDAGGLEKRFPWKLKTANRRRRKRINNVLSLKLSSQLQHTYK
jgi:hypothetical protein